MSTVVRFDDVVKRYPRGGPRYASVRHDLARSIRRLGRRPAADGSEPRGTLALDHVSFEVGEGESFAIVGPNGAGKSTALKLVARISFPTQGTIEVRGRVGALIEVGSGVHPELTGRENIWLFGQILGMSKAEIGRRFDDIVEFAELPYALDTPLKMYSSGMQMRLGFAIASHLDPDVFVVDEALAVGDSGFAAKCVNRMRSLVRDGRSLILVSHHMPAIESVCDRGIVLNGGRVVFEGPARELVPRYLEESAKGLDPDADAARKLHAIRAGMVRATAAGDGARVPMSGQPASFSVPVFADESLEVVNATMVIVVLGNDRFLRLPSVDALGGSFTLPRGPSELSWTVDYLPLIPGAHPVVVELTLRGSDGRESYLELAAGTAAVSTPLGGHEVASALRYESEAFVKYSMSVSSEGTEAGPGEAS